MLIHILYFINVKVGEYEAGKGLYRVEPRECERRRM